MVRDIPKEVICKCDNRGMNVSGEYDIESNMHCPNCNEVVGDYESNDLWCKYCPECGQRLKYSEPEEMEVNSYITNLFSLTNNVIDDTILPKTAEEYMKMNPHQQLMVKLKWSTMYNMNELIDIFRQYEKPLVKKMYKFIDVIKNEEIKKYDKENLSILITKEFDLEKEDVNYLLKVSHLSNIKKPKRSVYNKYRLIAVNVRLQGNDYVEVCDN